MRVTFGSIFRNGLIDINRTTEELAVRQREVSSGRRIHLPSDDPAAMAAAMGERSEMAVLDQFTQTTDSVDSRLMVADSIYSDIINRLTNAQTRAAGGRSTILTQVQRDALAGEIRGAASAIFTAVNTGYRGIDGDAILQGSAAADVFQTLEALATAVQTGDMAGIDQGLADVGQAFDRVTNAQTQISVELARLPEDGACLDTQHGAADARRSLAEDARLAESISAMTQADAAHRAALGALANAGRPSLMDYLK